mgnify:CR=1 FL=1
MSGRKISTISCGAAGSKAFTRFLYPDWPAEKLGTRHWHYPRPDLAPAEFDGFVYLFSDPRNAVLSFFRRRERKHSNHGFSDAESGRREWPVSNLGWVRRHLENLGGDKAALNESWGLEDYLDHCDHDVFGLEAHLDAWLAEREREVLFVRFETLWTHEAHLRAIVGTSHSKLPAYAPRAADWRALSPEVQAKLNARYGDFAERLEAMPDIYGRFNGRTVTPVGPTLRA